MEEKPLLYLHKTEKNELNRFKMNQILLRNHFATLIGRDASILPTVTEQDSSKFELEHTKKKLVNVKQGDFIHM